MENVTRTRVKTFEFVTRERERVALLVLKSKSTDQLYGGWIVEGGISKAFRHAITQAGKSRDGYEQINKSPTLLLLLVI